MSAVNKIKQKGQNMKVAEIKSIIGSLSRSQGFYGRLWRDLEENEGWGELARAATKAGCKTELDFILFLEGG